MHYSIWLEDLVGKDKNPLKVRTEGNKKSIEKIPYRPTGLYVWVLFHLKLGLGRVPLNYRKIIINNTKKEMDSPYLLE